VARSWKAGKAACRKYERMVGRGPERRAASSVCFKREGSEDTRREGGTKAGCCDNRRGRDFAVGGRTSRTGVKGKGGGILNANRTLVLGPSPDVQSQQT
jgi:hypothetical protein